MMQNILLKPALVAVHIIRLCEERPQYLMLRRSSNYLRGAWQMVTGKIETDEKVSEGAIREVKEETGLTVDVLYSADFTETFYEIKSDSVQFVVHFAAFVSEQTVKISIREHDMFEWCSEKEVFDRLIFSGQKLAFQHILDNFINKKPLDFLKIKI